QRPALPRGTVDVQGRRLFVGRAEEGKPLDVVPMGVADEQVQGERLTGGLLQERLAELADTGARVEDEDVAAAAHLHADGGAAIQRGAGTGRRDRAPRAAEGDLHRAVSSSSPSRRWTSSNSSSIWKGFTT